MTTTEQNNLYLSQIIGAPDQTGKVNDDGSFFGSILNVLNSNPKAVKDKPACQEDLIVDFHRVKIENLSQCSESSAPETTPTQREKEMEFENELCVQRNRMRVNKAFSSPIGDHLQIFPQEGAPKVDFVMDQDWSGLAFNVQGEETSLCVGTDRQEELIRLEEQISKKPEELRPHDWGNNVLVYEDLKETVLHARQDMPQIDSATFKNSVVARISGFQKRHPQVDKQQQSESTRKYLKKLAIDNQYNAYCVDCQTNLSTHSNITYGTFICGDCARVHNKLYGFSKHYIKDVFNEHWDPHQMNVVYRGGNQSFHKFLRIYKLESTPIDEKYSNAASKFYRKSLIGKVMGKPANVKRPLGKNEDPESRQSKKIDKFIEKLFA